MTERFFEELITPIEKNVIVYVTPLNSKINAQKEKLPRTATSKGDGITSSLNRGNHEILFIIVSPFTCLASLLQ